MNPLLARWFRLRDYLTEDFLGGPKVVKFAWSINLQKGSTLFFVLALMAAFGDFSATAWTYAALHGSYGCIWLLKDRAIPSGPPTGRGPGCSCRAFLAAPPRWKQPRRSPDSPHRARSLPASPFTDPRCNRRNSGPPARGWFVPTSAP